MLTGVHTSIVGGLYKALLRGKELGCETVQIFLRSNLAWNPGKFTPEAAQRFTETQAQTGITPVVAHNCYLVNLAATNRVTLTRSMLVTARCTILVAAGEAKRVALDRLLAGDPTLPARGFPASRWLRTSIRER